jgi:hypothetical protein
VIKTVPTAIVTGNLDLEDVVSKDAIKGFQMTGCLRCLKQERQQSKTMAGQKLRARRGGARLALSFSCFGRERFGMEF